MHNDPNQRKILFLSYFFPPRTEVGGKRIDKMCALAIRRGWQPYVVSIRGTEGGDFSIAERSGTVSITLLNSEGTCTGGVSRSGAARLFNRLKRYNTIIRDIAGIYRAARALASDESIGIVVATAPPGRVLVAALLLKLFGRNIKLVTDFRDPWQGMNRGVSLNPEYIVRQFLLPHIIRKADIVTAVSRSNLELLQRYGIDENMKFLCVPNAVSLDLYEGIKAQRTAPESKIVFGHLGDLDYKHRNPIPLFKALSIIRRKNRALFDQLEFHFWGQSGHWNGDDLNSLIKKAGLSCSAFYHGVVDHASALGIVKGLDALVLFAFDQPLQIPAKTYEYILSGKPILAMCEEQSETGSLLSEYAGIEIASLPKAHMIRHCIEKICSAITEHDQKHYTRDYSNINYKEVFSPLHERLEEMLSVKN